MILASLVCLVFLWSGVSASALPPTFQSDVDRILALANNSNTGFQRLTDWVDAVGHRLSGSQALEKGLDWALDKMTQEGFEQVHGENATIPHWVRGDESLTLMEPYVKKMGLLGIGTSVGGNINGEVLVVQTYDQLNETAAGKIVLFNYQCDWKAKPDDCYSEMATYRVDGASKAAKVGAIAALCRSLTGMSLYTPHTGVQHYADGVKKIPIACITTEDSDFLQRLQDRGTKISVSLKMGAQTLPDVTSRNILAEITGSEFPEQVILIGGHTDSWDVGQGAEDDGAGFMVSWEALSLIQRAGLKPRRTIRLIGWVCEEFGGVGAKQYFADHKKEAGNMSLVFESDLGVFQPYGLEFSGKNPAAIKIMQDIMAFAAPLNASRVVSGGQAEDIDMWEEVGVPGATPFNDGTKYFNYHHTDADMISHVPQEWFETSAASLAIGIYGVSILDDLLPR